MIGSQESSVRSAARRTAHAGGRARCSCELLLSLCAAESVRAVLTPHGATAAQLQRAVADLHAAVEAEPADWRVRIGQRSAGRGADADLDLLLALVRSADCHAYQLLERAGVSCGQLRKQLIDAMRALEAAALAGARPGRAEPDPADMSEGTAPPARTRPARGGLRRAVDEPGEAPRRLARAGDRPASGDMSGQTPERRVLREGANRPVDPRRAAVSADRPRRLSEGDARPRRLAAASSDPETDARPRRLAAASSDPEADSRPRRLAAASSDPETDARPRRLAAAEPLRRPADADERPRRLGSDGEPARRRQADDERPVSRILPLRTGPSAQVLPDRSADARPAAEPAAEARSAEAEPRRGRPTPIDPAALPPLHGREGELARLADAVLRRSPRPPLLVGAPGSGRTLVARHLARLLHQPVFYLSAARYEGEDDLRADLAAVARQGGVAVLDDLDRVGGEGPPELLAALTKAWSSGQPPVVAVASPESQARLQSWSPGLAAALDVVALQPLEGDDLRAAVAAAAPAVLAQHGLSLGLGVRLVELARLTDRFLGGLAQPGRSLDLLDLSCARTAREGRSQVSRDTWIDIVCERSGVPRERIEGLGHQEMLELEAELAHTVVGHEAALKSVSQLIRRNRAGFGSQRPVATVLLLGPSGVGKTEIAKALCAALFDRPDALVRLDMSEYAEAHAVARIVGAPPGYVGHEQGGALTDPLLRQPHCVVLLDEIEKAHRDVHQLLLQVFDEGRLTDGRGRTIDFRHAVVLMTSNLGATCLDAGTGDARLDEARVLEAARAAFPVELWNRIEAPLVLHPLTEPELARICGRLVKASSDRLLRERGIRYRLSEAATRHVVAQCGRDASLGARPLRHVLTRSVESLLADAILRGQVRAGMQVEVDAEDGALILLAVRG